MIFCHAPLPINKKSSIACNLMHYYKSVYMSKGKKQDLTPRNDLSDTRNKTGEKNLIIDFTIEQNYT